jgi:PAT family beta-lactamase induction signal transducer AmpG
MLEVVKQRLPPWAMGLAMAPFGFYCGFVTTAIPVLLAADSVPLERIAYVSAVGLSPTFWAFLLSPVLDARFTRRTYGFALAGLAATCLAASVLLLHHLAWMTVALAMGCTAVVMYGNALSGWLANIVEARHYGQVGAWSNVANLGAAGAFGTLAVVLVRHLPPALAAPALAVVLAAPTLLFFFFPPPEQPTRGMAALFRTLFRDIYRVCRNRRSMQGFLLFLSPASCFALTNLFTGMGNDFHAPERWVVAIGGTGVAVVCSLGCLFSIGLCKRMALSTVYLGAGLCGAIFAFGLLLTPHTLTAFVVGVLGYNFCQGMNYTAFSALSLEIVGPGNPLAATQMGLLAASANLPISYMTALEGHVYAASGLRGMLALDGSMSLVAGTILLVVVHKMTANRLAIIETSPS